MELVGESFVIPLFNATLISTDKFDLGDGISIIGIPDTFEEKLRSSPELIARYESSLEYMKVGLELVPSNFKENDALSIDELLKIGIFLSMTLRLATGVPIDMPFWFDFGEEEIKSCGNTLVKTYHLEKRYLFTLNEGEQSDGLQKLGDFANELIKIYRKDPTGNVLMRAIEFVSVGFQNFHIPSSLVNNVVFLESLFSSSNNEISFQVASSVSWFLYHNESDDKREDLFTKIKKLYNFRSKIFHGGDIKNESEKIKENLKFSQELNTKIFQHILNSQHFPVFCQNQNERQIQLKKLLTV